METARVERKLTTILVADAAGYSRAMAADETAALTALRKARAIFARLIERHRGRIFSKAGDGLLAEFSSVVEAVQCAIEVQRELAGRHAAAGSTEFRIGIHLGDVMVDGEDLIGDGVNLAARLESMAEPGGILISQPVYDQVRGKLEIGFDYLGQQRPKNLNTEVPVYRVTHSKSPRKRSRHTRWGHGGWARAVGATASDPGPSRPAVDSHSSQGPLPDDRAGCRRWARLKHRARVLCVIWLALVAVDVLSGSGVWAQWPGLAILAFLGFEAAPLLTRSWFDTTYARMAIVIVTLTLINLATWTGTLWVVWPALALVVFEAIRRLWKRS